MKIIKKIVGFISLVCIAVTLVGCESTSILDGAKKEFKANGYSSIMCVKEKGTESITGKKCKNVGNRRYLYNIFFTKQKKVNGSIDEFAQTLKELKESGVKEKGSYYSQNKKKNSFEFYMTSKDGKHSILSYYVRYNKHYAFGVERRLEYTGTSTTFSWADYEKQIKITKQELRKAEKIGDKCFKLSKKHKFSKKVMKGDKKHD